MANPKKPTKTTKKPAAKKTVQRKAKKPAKKPVAAKPTPSNMDARRVQAYKYYVEFNIEQKEIARIVGVSVQTITKWKQEDEWDNDKEDMQLAPERIMRRVIKQYDALLDKIEQRTAPDNVPNSGEGDTLNKLADSIKKLRTEIGKGHKSEVGKQFISYIMTTYGKPKGIELLDYWNEFYLQTS